MNPAIAPLLSPAPPLHLVSHIMGGYPSLEHCAELLLRMDDAGVSLVEVQVPFSDPLSDGPVLRGAGAAALAAGIRPDDVLELAGRMAPRLRARLVLVAYANTALARGWERFAQDLLDHGLAGAIIPDMPLDADNGIFPKALHAKGLAALPLVSPDIPPLRLAQVLSHGSGLCYSTLRSGVTGAESHVDPAARKWLDALRQQTDLPLLAGFGIRSVEAIQALEGHCDAVVVGSHLTRLLQEGGPVAVGAFLQKIGTALRSSL